MNKEQKKTKKKAITLDDLNLDNELLKNVIGGESSKNKTEVTSG